MKKACTLAIAVVSLAVIASTLGACGGGAELAPAKAPASPAPAKSGDAQPRAAVMSEPSPATAAPPAGAMAPPTAPSSTSPPSSQEREEATTSMAGQVSAEMKKAEHDIAAGDCPTACRALGSMEHAVVFLCAENQSTDDADRCDNARHHLASARRRIRTTCGNCPGGPSVDPDAPIPSKR